MYRQFTKAEDLRRNNFRNNRGQNAPTKNLAVTDVGNRPSMTDSNVLPKKPSVDLVEKEAIIKQYVEQRTLEKFITKSMIVMKIVTKKCS